MYGLTFHLLNVIIGAYAKLMVIFLCRQALYISKFLFIIVTCLSRSILRINKHSSIHTLQLGFVNISISPIGFRCFTTLNFMYLCRSIRDVVALTCCSKWAANYYGFCLFLEGVGDQRNYCPFFSWMSAEYTLYK